MDIKIKNELERARSLFYSWRLLEAYQIFRRYFDRLPFKQDPEHAEYIGMFTRTLLELGKEWELKFYMSELEKLYEKLKTPEIGYQLAVVYSDGKTPHLKAAKKLLQEVISNPKAQPYHNKAKMRLAYCYDVIDQDSDSCKRIIESITQPIEESLVPLVEIWKAKVLKDLKRYSESETLLKEIIKENKKEENWYVFFSANYLLAFNYIESNRIPLVLPIYKALTSEYEKQTFKSIHHQLMYLKKRLDSATNSKKVDKENDLEFFIQDKKEVRVKNEV